MLEHAHIHDSGNFNTRITSRFEKPCMVKIAEELKEQSTTFYITNHQSIGNEERGVKAQS